MNGVLDRVAVEHLAELTTRLVAFRTVSGETNGELQACVEYVRAHIRDRVPAVHEWAVPIAGGKPSLLCSIGDEPPRLLLCGHVDVVAATDEAAFSAYRVGGKGSWLVGRGTADMKGPVAALIDIFESDQVRGLGILLTSDEESGGNDGTRHVLECIPWRPDVVLLPDGGANMRLVTEQKGLLRMRLDAMGRAAHAARPWKGKNAAERLYQAHRLLKRAYGQPRGESDWRPSISLTYVQTGKNNWNVVPDHAEAVVDMRYPGSGPFAWTKATLLQDIQSRLGNGRNARLQVQVTELLDVDPFLLDTDSPWIEHLQTVVKQVQDEPLPLHREAGGSDARFFCREGIPVLMYQPRCEDAHGSHERISMESLAEFREITARFVRRVLHRSDRAAASIDAPRSDAGSARS